MSAPKLYVLHAPGTNRDEEAAWAAETAGFAPDIVHIAEAVSGGIDLADAAAVVVPGGFSYGDALGAGVRLALDLRLGLTDTLRSFVDGGGLLVGICNGFQALVKSGLLPGGSVHAPRAVTLTENELGRFECRWVHLEVDRACAASWLAPIAELIHCPVAHGEGRFLTTNEAELGALADESLVAFRYVDAAGAPAKGRYPINPNGSVGDIAGICDPTGRIVGLMPHPEDHIVHRQRPHGPPGQLGLALFDAMRNAL